MLPSRSSSKAARPKRLQYDSSDGIEGELNAEDSLQQFHHRQHALTDIAEGDEDDEDFGYDSSKVELSDSEEDPPSQYSTPLKTAYSRQALAQAFHWAIYVCIGTSWQLGIVRRNQNPPSA